MCCNVFEKVENARILLLKCPKSAKNDKKNLHISVKLHVSRKNQHHICNQLQKINKIGMRYNSFEKVKIKRVQLLSKRPT